MEIETSDLADMDYYEILMENTVDNELLPFTMNFTVYVIHPNSAPYFTSTITSSFSVTVGQSMTYNLPATHDRESDNV